MISRCWKPLLPLLAVAVSFGGCKDERESLTGAGGFQGGVLDADLVYGVAFVSSTIYEFQNRMVQTCLEMYEAGQTLQVLISCGGGTGDATVVVEDPFTAPMSFTIRFDRYRVNCLAPLPLTVAGILFVDFQSISPLSYTITQPFCFDPASIPQEHCHPDSLATPLGTTYTLSNDFDNLIVDVTTPGQLIFQNNEPTHFEQPYLLCEESNGLVSITGTTRIEIRSQDLLIVENLDLTYGYSPQRLVRFDEWPGGRYEYAAHQGISDPPGVARFDGDGGCTFDYFGRTCETDLSEFDPSRPLSGNPCAGL